MEIIHQGKYRNVRLTVVKGDITNIKADCIMGPGNAYGKMGGGCVGRIKTVGGQQIENEITKKSPIDVGDCVVVEAGKLQSKGVKYVIYCAIMKKPVDTTCANSIRKAIYKGLVKADEIGCKSIAIPAMGTGVGRLPYKVSTDSILCAVKKFVDKKPKRVRSIILDGYSVESVTSFIHSFDLLYNRSIDNCAILVIDLIKPFVGNSLLINNAQIRRLCKKINPILSVASKKKKLVIYIKDVHNENDPELLRSHYHCVSDPDQIEYVDALRPPTEEDIEITKNCYSAFYNPDLERELRKRKVETLIVCGIQTHVCVKYTSLDAFERGFRVIVLSDCTGASHKKKHLSGLEEIKTYLGEISKSTYIRKIIESH